MYDILEALRPKKYTVRYPRSLVGKPLLYTACALASLGDALFGYSQGITAAFQVQHNFIHRMYGKTVTEAQIQWGETAINPFLQAITVACLNVTALFATLVGAYISDILGRRVTIRIGAIIYFVAAVLQIFAMDLSWLIAGRSLQGIGVGLLSTTVPVYQCEISPAHSRGLFVSIEYFFLNCGYLASAWIGYAFFFKMPSDISWRGPYIVQAALALILAIWSLFLPETPRWLIRHGFFTEGLWTLADLHGSGDITDVKINDAYNEIVDAIEFEEREGAEASWKELFQRYTRRTIIGITSQMFSQLNGINAILHFLPENLDRAGFTIQQSLLYAGACGIIYCAGTIPTIFWIDKFGRRLFLLIGSIGLAVSLSLVGGLQFYVDTLPEGMKRWDVANWIFGGVGLYLFVFGATWGPIPWILARAKGAALADVSNWIFNFCVAFISPPLFEIIPGGYYFLLVGSCLFSFVFVWFVYPETAHAKLEDLGQRQETGRDKAGVDSAYLVTDVAPSITASQVTLGSGGPASSKEGLSKKMSGMLG
ncbi:general substrate transporter [Mycena floridula]|nr:general substrate transporter [Mycena floridula]